MPTEIENTLYNTHLRRRISLGMNHSYCHKPLHKRSVLTEKTPYPYNWSTLTMKSFPSIEANYCGDTLRSVKCIYSRDLHNSTDRLRWLLWPLRAQIIWTIKVHLPYQWFSTAITLMAMEAICDYYYRQTKKAVDFRQHPRPRERQNYDSRLPPPEAPLSGEKLEDPINRWQMDNQSFHL